MNEYSNDDQDRKGFDVIIGSDCLYSGMEAVQQLFSLVAIMLAENIDNAGDKIFESNTDIANNYTNSSCQNSSDKHGNGDYDDKNDDDHLSPTSVDGGGWMLVDSVPEKSMSINSYEAHSDPNYNDKKKGSGVDIQPVFILGYERRLGGANVDMYAMFEIAAGLGFEWCIAEDSVIDIFGNETSEQTLLWEQCIFLFTRKRQLRSNSEKG